MLKKTPLASAISSITVASAIAAGGAALPAYAADDQMLEEVVVTGSRIRDANLISSSPITTISQEEFDYSGATRVEDLLNTFPQIANSFDAFTVNPTTGFATADLYGLGTQRTLVLVNGNRMQSGGIRSQAPDLNQIPAALVQRVEILTGGASAVYGSDAMAGVVNFILDDNFEGVSLNVGYSAYMHDNSNGYMQGLMDDAGFDYPTGNSGFDGESRNVDFAMGAPIADGAGHAMGWVTWRKNKALLQGERDFSSCALNAAGTACGGSSTNADPNFLVFGINALDAGGNQELVLDATSADPVTGLYQNDAIDPDTGNPIPLSVSPNFVHVQNDGTWGAGVGELYNFAPINHFQRPDERWTLGGAMHLELNEHFTPYLETMVANTNTRVQIAESGTFFVNRLSFTCADPLVSTLCNDITLTQRIGDDLTDQIDVDDDGNPVYAPITQEVFADPTQEFDVYVGKRNVEGGPRTAVIESTSFRLVVGTRGAINESWSYDASMLYARGTSSEGNINDLVVDRVGPALLQCPAGSYAGCVPYNIWTPTGAVTPAAAAGLSGTGMRTHSSELQGLNAYVTGVLPFSMPTSNDNVSLVGGIEYRDEKYFVDTDANMQSGNFTGLGGPRLPVGGGVEVSEVYAEAGVPIIDGGDVVQSLSVDLGARYSDYSSSGGVATFKIGASAQITDLVRVRGGFNRAIRAANVGELYSSNQIALWGGEDPCAGATPELSQAQCANTGVTAAQYGFIVASPADQYNQFIGGADSLDPEKADTLTLGAVVSPIDNLQLSVDYYDIQIEDRVGTMGANTALRFCATTGDAFYCDRVNRNAASGDLWVGSNPATSGYITNLNENIGELHFSGVNINATYSMGVGAGTLTASLAGTYALKNEIAPLAGIDETATYDCVGIINTTCNFPQTPEWRHTARVSYIQDWWTATVRWRFVGELDYENIDGSAGTADQILVGNGGKLDSMNYIDVTGVFEVMDNVNIIVGMNNLFDEEPPLVGGGLVLNANAPGGYDQVGRYFHTTATLRY